MDCPACGNTLYEVTIGEITVDVCQEGCGGIWFDTFELRKVDEPHESLGESLLDIEGGGAEVDFSGKRTCPRCGDTVMARHFFSVKMAVEVDECPKCGGFWLDRGELAKIRTLFGSEEEGRKAAREYFSNAFGPELAAVAAKGEADRQKAQDFARMFRFMCPSYYLPGKQDWGAF